MFGRLHYLVPEIDAQMLFDVRFHEAIDVFDRRASDPGGVLSRKCR